MDYQPLSNAKFSLAAQHKEFFCECINAQCVHVHPLDEFYAGERGARGAGVGGVSANPAGANAAANRTAGAEGAAGVSDFSQQGAASGTLCAPHQPLKRCRIGVFDSGLGGISVLRKAITRIPSADFLFFGDSAFAPYGSKPCSWVKKRACEIIEAFIEAQVDAVIIACNTATSVAINYARATYPSLPLFGIEPALKPAVETLCGKRILVMATPVTLKLDRYHALSKKWAHLAHITPVACEGLADRIEQGNFEASDFTALLKRLIGAYAGKIDGVVLGCTHYPFIKKQIRDVLGNVVFFDGSLGTANYVHTCLVQKGLIDDTPDMFATSASACSSFNAYDERSAQDTLVSHVHVSASAVSKPAAPCAAPQHAAATTAHASVPVATQAVSSPLAAVPAPAAPYQHVVSLQTSDPQPEMLKRYQLFLTSYFEQ